MHSKREVAMAKRLKLCVLVLASVFLLLSGTVFAFPIEVEGFVNPGNAIYEDLGDGFTQVGGLEYTFKVVFALKDAEMNYLQVEFENDVFRSVSAAYNYDPSDWSTSAANTRDSLYALSFAGSTIGAGETLSFDVDVIMYTVALTDSGIWNEGQVWAQSWASRDTWNGIDGGSTAPVPEPATMLLLGTGLVGLAGIGRKKFFKK